MWVFCIVCIVVYNLLFLFQRWGGFGCCIYVSLLTDCRCCQHIWQKRNCGKIIRWRHLLANVSFSWRHSGCSGISSFHMLWSASRSPTCVGCAKGTTHTSCELSTSPEAMKSATLLRQDQHLREATTERIAYQAACAYSKTFAEEQGISELGRSDKPPAPSISFDFAQQLHYPANPRQPGPVFFKTPHKM